MYPYVRQNIDLNPINTDIKENMLFQMSYPNSESKYVTANPFEIISVLITGLIPMLPKPQDRRSIYTLGWINKYRRKNGIPIIPAGLIKL